jgi:hypothetical protein
MAFGKPKDDDVVIIDGLGDVDDNPFYVPPGEYKAQVTACEKKTSEAGNPMLVFTFTIETKGDAKGKDLKTHAVLTPAGLWRVKQVLVGLGFPPPPKGKSLEIRPKECIGRKAVVKVVDKEYNGETRSEIRTVKPLTAAGTEAAA